MSQKYEGGFIKASDALIGPCTVNGSAFTALWDTGTTSTLVSPWVAMKLGLIASGTVQVKDNYAGTGAKAGSNIPFYFVDLNLPGVRIENLRVAEVNLGYDVVIGMDVIGRGTLKVQGGRLKFTL